MKLYKEGEVICRKLGYKEQISESLGYQALILEEWGKLNEAMKLAEEAYTIATDLGLPALVQEIKPTLDGIRDAIDNRNKD